MAADLMLPYGCRNGACGTCKGKILDGRVDYGPHQPSTLTDDEKRQGLALFCCAKPLTDLVLEVKEVRKSGDIQIRKLPCRIESIDKPAPDVAIVRIKLPANERLQYLAGQYIDLLLKDGRRRSFSLATSPHDDALLELHVRHVPGGHFTNQLFSEYKGREILRFEGPLGTFFLREESDKPIIFVAGGTGFAPIKGIIEHALHRAIDATRPMVLYWGARAQRDLYLPDLPGPLAAAKPQLHVHSGAVGSRARGRLARTQRTRAPGGARRFRRPFRISGLRLRRTRDGRRRAQELHRDARIAGGGFLRRQLHLRGAAAGRWLTVRDAAQENSGSGTQAAVPVSRRSSARVDARSYFSSSASASFSAAASCALASPSRPSRANSSPSATRVRQLSSSARLASR